LIPNGLRTRPDRDNDDGRRTIKKEISLRIKEQDGGKRPRNGAGEMDFDREEQRGITERYNRTGGRMKYLFEPNE